MRVESSVWDDPRFELLSGFCGFSDADLARIKCVRVWGYCTERCTDLLSAQVIDALVRVPGFAEKMADAELAERTKKGFRIRGAKGRIEWLKAKRDAGSSGGKKSAATRADHLKHTSSTPQAHIEHTLSIQPSTTQPSYSALSLSLSPALVPSPPQEESRTRATEPWLRVWQIFEELTGAMQGSASGNHQALAAIAHACASRGDIETAARKCLAAWLADPWVARTKPPISHLAKNPGKYLDARRRSGKPIAAEDFHDDPIPGDTRVQ